MTAARQHLESLDVFRGAAVAAMILVNNPGDWNTVFPQLMHANWNGFTFADAVFPFFVFIMGCAMPFAFARHDARSSGPWELGARVLRRAVTLVGLGLALNLAAAFPHVTAIRVPGVLQRLGLAYLCAALIVRSCGAVTQAVVAVVLLIGHWAAMTLVPFGGHIATAVTREHNLAGHIDAAMFGSHTLRPGFDPEGLLGTAPTVATALIGALAGRWLQRQSVGGQQRIGLAAWGATAIVAGLAWSIVWPLNKPLWTGSYALVASGLAAVTLAASAYVIDVRGLRGWDRPFLWLGANPLAIYFCSELAAQLIERPLMSPALGRTSPKDWLYWNAVAPVVGNARGEWASLVYAIGFVGCWIGVAAVLHRRGIRIRA